MRLWKTSTEREAARAEQNEARAAARTKEEALRKRREEQCWKAELTRIRDEIARAVAMGERFIVIDHNRLLLSYPDFVKAVTTVSNEGNVLTIALTPDVRGSDMSSSYPGSAILSLAPSAVRQMVA